MNQLKVTGYDEVTSDFSFIYILCSLITQIEHCEKYHPYNFILFAYLPLHVRTSM